MSTQETKLQTIANAIRVKEGSTAPIPANSFAERILALQTVGGSSNLYRINLLSTNATGGTVHGSGIASKDMSVNVSVTVNDGYYFEGWTENGATVSEAEELTFSVQRDRNLIANVFEIQYSLGVDWLPATLPKSSQWQSVEYGGGKFVAVSSEPSAAAYSTDGINWATTTMPVSTNWYSVTYGNGKFVAVAAKNSAAYSTDGVNWTASKMPATMPSSTGWRSVTYGGGKFVAVAGSAVAYSTDGINWTAATMPVSAGISVAYGGGKFVAVANNAVAYSTDGINWTAATMPSSENWKSIAYGGGKFAAVAYYSNKAAYSQGGSATS